MKLPHLIIILGLCAICLAVGLSLLAWSRSDPFDRFAGLQANVGRLRSSPAAPYRFQDYVVRLLHWSDPRAYYEKMANTEKKALIASGRLVEVSIPYTTEGAHSATEIARGLARVSQRTGAFYSIEFDHPNHLVLVLCRPLDVRQFEILK